MFQETHLCSQETIDKISKNWDGKSFWSPGSPGSSGVAILFKPDLNFQLLDSKQDLEGRVMSILISCGKLKLNIISIYAPNLLRSRKEFYRNLHEYFFTGRELIIGGDFNCIDSNLDKYGGNSDMGFTGKDEVAKLKRDFFLKDIWRTKKERTRQFTWFNSNASIACRLDAPGRSESNACVGGVKRTAQPTPGDGEPQSPPQRPRISWDMTSRSDPSDDNSPDDKGNNRCECDGSPKSSKQDK